jgi:hypothetical protein
MYSSYFRNAPNMDLGALGLGPSSARVRVGRNLASFPLPGAMNKDQRCAMEEVMSKAYLSLAKLNMPEGKPFGGRYYSLTPGRSDSINDEEYKQLIKEHLMFKDMDVSCDLAASIHILFTSTCTQSIHDL